MTSVRRPEGDQERLGGVDRLVVVRHASTAWTKAGRHTGRTDIPLDSDGRVAAERLRPVLAAFGDATVYSSPLGRARETCELAGRGEGAQIDADLSEWDYGAYEGRTSAEIDAERPGWNLFADGCPGGERADDVGLRADRFLARIATAGDPVVMAFAHGHLLRVLAARWLGLSPGCGQLFVLDAPSVGTLGREHGLPAISTWNR
jgi:broad specificity phosphatase PhoE